MTGSFLCGVASTFKVCVRLRLFAVNSSICVNIQMILRTQLVRLELSPASHTLPQTMQETFALTSGTFPRVLATQRAEPVHHRL
jgi:hypothetical protein